MDLSMLRGVCGLIFRMMDLLIFHALIIQESGYFTAVISTYYLRWALANTFSSNTHTIFCLRLNCEKPVGHSFMPFSTANSTFRKILREDWKSA